MILEAVMLRIKMGQSGAFEMVISQALSLVQPIKDYISHEL